MVQCVYICVYVKTSKYKHTRSTMYFVFADGGNTKKEKGSMSPTFDPTSAFLGPNLWSASDFTSDGDISLEYMDLDEFLSENGIPVDLNENSNGSDKSSTDLPVKVTSPKPTEPDSTQSLSTPQSPVSEVVSLEEAVTGKLSIFIAST